MTPSASGLSRIPDTVLLDIKRRYAEPQRHYHTWDHITALLGWFDQRAGELNDPDAVFLAILFHDAIYDPRRSDNEALSEQFLAQGALPDWSVASVRQARRMIEATASHIAPSDLEPSEAADLATFLDMDMSILGASRPAFEAYDKAIRREYRHVPLLLYRPARKRILRDFLNRADLYLSEWGREQFDQAARLNLGHVLGEKRLPLERR